MLKYILGFLLIGSFAIAAGRFQDSDFASSGDITGAGGSVSQLLNTSKIYDNVNAQVLNTTLSAKVTNPMTTAEDIIKGGASGAPTRLAVGSNGQCLVVSGGAVAWGACGTSSPLTTKGDLYTYDTGNQRLAVGTNGQVLSANSATATGLEWITPASGGDFSSNTASSVDGEVVVFDGTGGKTGKRATGTGVAKLTSGVLSVSNVDLTSEVTGVLPLANGGSNKNLTAANGGIVYSDADSFEILAAGTAGQVLQSNGAAAPSWVAPSGGGAAEIAGEAYIAPTTGCEPTRSNTTFGQFSDDTDCPGPTIVEENLGDWQTTDSDNIEFAINSLPAGRYVGFLNLYHASGTNGVTCSVYFSDGTFNSSVGSVRTDGSSQATSTLVIFLDYASSGNRTFSVYGKTNTGDVCYLLNYSGASASYGEARFQLIKISD